MLNQKKMTIQINKSSIAIVIMAGVILFMGYKLLQPADNTSHLIEMQYQAERFTKDSLALVESFRKEISGRDSAIAYSQGQIKVQQSTIKYYEKKIFNSQHDPIYIVDQQLDSILTAIRTKYR